MKIKLCFFVQNLNGGGAERVIVTLLKQIDLTIYDVSIVMVSKSGPLVESLPKEIEIIDLKISKTILSVFALAKYLSAHKPDIVFSSLLRTHGVLYWATKIARIKPKIILRSPNSPKHSFETNELNWVTAKLLNSAYKNCDIIIAQTGQMKKELTHYFKVEESHIEIMSNPIDTYSIDKMVEDDINPFEQKDRINIVAAGRLVDQKGFDVLIKSFAIAFAKNPKLLLNIIGEDVIKKKVKLERLAKKLGVAEHVVFLGFQPNPYQYFNKADLFVLSSRTEGMPNTVVENIYLQKRIVATKCIDYIEELIIHNENGILVEVEDEAALAQAILDYETIDPSNDTLSINHKNSGFNSILESCSANLY